MLNKTIDVLEETIENKVNITEYNKLKHEVKTLSSKFMEQETNAIMKESYDKRFNLIIHGLDEHSTSP